MRWKAVSKTGDLWQLGKSDNVNYPSLMLRRNMTYCNAELKKRVAPRTRLRRYSLIGAGWRKPANDGKRFAFPAYGFAHDPNPRSEVTA